MKNTVKNCIKLMMFETQSNKIFESNSYVIELVYISIQMAPADLSEIVADNDNIHQNNGDSSHQNSKI